jgi:predicted DNA-binding transcriptional regulator AlpA
VLGVNDYLTTAQAGELLGIDTRTVYYYARDVEDFPQPNRFGRALMWRAEDLAAWRSRHPARTKPPTGDA